MYGWQCDCCSNFYSTSETLPYDEREKPVMEVTVHYTGDGEYSDHNREYTYCEECADEPEVVNIKTLGENVEN